MPYTGNKPSAVPLTSADIADSIITSAKIVDATIANADIANSTINLTTKVTGTLPVANGGTGLAAIGTAAQVLRVNSGATALEFATPASGSFVFLGETSASNATSASLNGFFTSDYDVYKIFVLGLLSATDGQPLYVRFATTGSYTEQSSGYSFSIVECNGTVTYEYGTAQSQIRTNYVMSNTAGAQSNLDMTLYNPNRGDQYKSMTWNFFGQSGNISQFTSGSGGGLWKDTTPITGLKFFAASGNLYATKIKIYGVKNT
jgi:hypothetical protein